MKKVVRFLATRRFSFLDIVVISAFTALLDADHIAWAFATLITGVLVSLIAEEATQ